MGVTFETQQINSGKRLEVSKVEFLDDSWEKIGEGLEGTAYRVRVRLENGLETTLIYKQFHTEDAANYHLVMRDRGLRADLPVPDIFIMVVDKGIAKGILMEDYEKDNHFFLTSNNMKMIHLHFKLLLEKNPDLLYQIAYMDTDIDFLAKNILINSSQNNLLIKSADTVSWVLPEGNPIISDFGNIYFEEKLKPVEVYAENKKAIQTTIFLLKNAAAVAKKVLNGE